MAAGQFNTLALRSDGTVVGWGNDWFGQNDVTPLDRSSSEETTFGENSHTLLPLICALLEAESKANRKPGSIPQKT